MPKKRKTREQKIHSEHKKETVHQTVSSHLSSEATFSLSSLSTEKPIIKKTLTQPTVIAVETDGYNYLQTDLLKTTIITCAIVITEIVVKILFRGYVARINL